MTLHLTFTAATAGKQQRQRRRQQQQLKTRALFTSVALARSLSLPPHCQAAILASRSAAHAHHDKRAAAAATASKQQQQFYLHACPRSAGSPTLSLCRCCAYAPTALRPLLLSGTFYESQRLFRTKLIIFTAYAVVDSCCCCCCSLLLLLLFRYHFACAAHLINLMQKSPQRFTLAVPLKLAYLSRWLLFNYAACSLPLFLPASPLCLVIC